MSRDFRVLETFDRLPSAYRTISLAGRVHLFNPYGSNPLNDQKYYLLLKLNDEPHKIRVEPLPFVIGREDDCHLRLKSSSISRRHCELKIKSGQLTVKDLGSRNGTYLNGTVIEPEKRVLLKDRDVLGVGKVELVVVIKSAAATKMTLLPKSSLKPKDLLPKPPRPPVESTEEPDVSTWVNDAADIGQTMFEPYETPETAKKPQEETQPSSLSETADLSTGDAETKEDKLTEFRRRLKGGDSKDSKDAASKALRRYFGNG